MYSLLTVTSEKVIELEELAKATPHERRSWINRTCVFNNALKSQGCPNDFISYKEKFYFLIRKEALELMDYVDNLQACDGRITDLGKALFGSGGTGKSSLLFFIANYCHKKEWVVMYWPHGSNTSEEVFTTRKSDRYVNLFLEDNPSYTAFKGEHAGTRNLLGLLHSLYEQGRQKVLVAIDQWNVFLTNLRNKQGDDGAFLDYFRTFQNSGDLTSGIFIGALSSQPFFQLPLDVFPDATKQSSSIVITPYTPTEFKAHTELAIHCKMIERPLTLEQLSDYQFETGGIPRLLNWIF